MSAVAVPAGTPATREDVVGILRLLSTRMHWLSAKALISSTGIRTSRGWSETIDNVAQDFYSDSIWAAAKERLGTAATLHTHVGNKRVTFFDLREQNSDVRNRIVSWAAGSAINDLGKLLRDSPFEILDAPTDHATLEGMKSLNPTLVHASAIQGRIYAQFFSTRSHATREPVDLSKLTTKQRAVFDEYDDVIGVRTKWVPCFDTVVLDPATDLAEFRIDYAPGLGLVGQRDDIAFSRLMTEFLRVTNKFVGEHALAASMMNLFPAIEPLYLDKKCGRVTALGFVATSTDSSSNNHGQIHRTKTQDFRKDRFHVGGAASVDKVDPYAIGVTWAAEANKDDLVLEIRSSARAMYSGKLRAVTVAEIEGCRDFVDYDFVASQVLSRLKRRSS